MHEAVPARKYINKKHEAGSRFVDFRPESIHGPLTLFHNAYFAYDVTFFAVIFLK
jgi:hypothetical protein